MTDEETDDEAAAIERVAENLIDREVLACQSSLVDSLLGAETGEEWTYESVRNLYPDVEEADFDRCYELVLDYGGDPPDPDPFDLNAEQLRDLVPDDVEFPAHDDEEARRVFIRMLNTGAVDGLEDWRDAARETGPREVYEWWLVTGYLAQELEDIGEPVLDNGFGRWWGRTCTGQSLLLDGTFQRIARRIRRGYHEADRPSLSMKKGVDFRAHLLHHGAYRPSKIPSQRPTTPANA